MKQPLKQLPTLKMKLITATEFNDVFNYFFDYFGENEHFLKLGEPTRHELLEKVLAHSVKSILGTDLVVIRNGFFIHLPGQRFIHGGCNLNGYIANFFYFDDIDSGMLVLASPPYEQETKFVRFSLQMLGQPSRTQSN